MVEIILFFLKVVKSDLKSYSFSLSEINFFSILKPSKSTEKHLGILFKKFLLL